MKITKRSLSYKMNSPSSQRLNIELVRSFHRVRVDSKHTCNFRDSDGIIYYLKGSQTFIFDDQTITASKDEVLYIPYGSHYKNVVDDPETEYYQIDFLIKDNGISTSLLQAPKLIGKPDSLEYRDYAKEIRHKNFATNNKYRFLCFSHLCKLIDMVVAQDDFERSTSLLPIKPSIDYINENYFLNTPISDIAALSSTCSTNLERLFKLHFHKSPTLYRNTVRINKSKPLLLSGLSIADVAEKMGFYDACHFSKTFKKLVGMSPGEYVKTGRQN